MNSNENVDSSIVTVEDEDDIPMPPLENHIEHNIHPSNERLNPDRRIDLPPSAEFRYVPPDINIHDRMYENIARRLVRRIIDNNLSDTQIRDLTPVITQPIPQWSMPDDFFSYNPFTHSLENIPQDDALLLNFGLNRQRVEDGINFLNNTTNPESNFNNESSRSSMNLRVESKEEEKKTFSSHHILCERYKDLELIKEMGLECPICLTVIKGTVAITTCLHKFCSSCLYNHCMSSHNACCPMCRGELNPENIIISSELTEYLDKCIVTCANLECNIEMTRREYNRHISVCEYNKIQCGDCSSLIYKKDKKTHEEECEFRSIKCNLCRSIIQYNNQEQHMNEDCLLVMIKCSNNKCNYTTQRHKIWKHKGECKYRNIPCNNGCSAIISCEDITLHNEICPMRKIECHDCKLPYSYINQEYHNDLCPEKSKECKYCKTSILNRFMECHIHGNCHDKPVQCPTCDITIERKNLTDHKNICINRPTQCVECDQWYSYSDYYSHIKTCQYQTIACLECRAEFIRKDKNIHTQKCLYQTLKCKYSYAGCFDSFLRSNETSHYNDHKDHHLDLLDKYIRFHVLDIDGNDLHSHSDDNRTENISSDFRTHPPLFNSRINDIFGLHY